MPLFNPNTREPYDINNLDHIFYAREKNTGYEVRAFDKRTMPIPTEAPVKVIPQELKESLNKIQMLGIAITIRKSNALYQEITLFDDSPLTKHSKIGGMLDQLLWVATVAAFFGLVNFCLRPVGFTSDQTLPLSCAFNQTIFHNLATRTSENTAALLLVAANSC